MKTQTINHQLQIDFNKILGLQNKKIPHGLYQFEDKQKQQLKQIIMGQYNLVQTQKQDIYEQLEEKLNQIKQITEIKAKSTKVDGMFVGIWIGISIAMFVLLILIINIFNLSILDDSKFSGDFPVWRGIAIIIFYVWALGVTFWLFQKFKFNYREIFNFAQNHHPQAVNIFKFAGFHTTVFLLCFLFYIFAYTSIYELKFFTPQYFGIAPWIIFFGTLFLPLPIFSHKGRFYIIKLFLNSIISPISGLNYSVIFIVDQLLSMAIPLKDFSYTICYYSNKVYQSNGSNECQGYNGAYTYIILTVYAGAYGIMQCMRQGYDNGKYFLSPLILDSLNFVCTIVATVLSFQYQIGNTSIVTPWLFFTIITTLFSYAWDAKMQWGFFQNNNKNPFLRQILLLPYRKIYYIIIILDFFLRCVWILSLSPAIVSLLGNSNLFTLIIGFMQIIRTSIFNFIKLQYQQIKLTSKTDKQPVTKKRVKKNKQKLPQSLKKLQIKLIRFYQKIKNKKQQSNNIVAEEIQNDQIKQYRQSKNKFSTGFDQQQFDQISQLMNEVYSLDPNLRKTIALDIKRSTMIRAKRQTIKNSLFNHNNHKSIQIQLMNRIRQF